MAASSKFRRSGAGLGRVLLVVGGLAVGFAIAEILVRVAAAYRADVKYLATAGIVPMTGSEGSLEDFMQKYKSYFAPHHVLLNYYSNALGFQDKEFSVDRPAGSLRIMALGDSFTAGSVAYPQNVLTVVEQHLRTDCRAENIETMNFGIPGTGVWDYLIVHRLAAPRYNPDVVVVHFYMGNDGPELIWGGTDVPAFGRRATKSYAWNYLKNLVRIARATRNLALGAVAPSPQQGALGGTRVNEQQPDPTDRDFPPMFTVEAFERIAAAEMGRLYARGSLSPAGADAWRRTLDVLDTLVAEVRTTTRRLPIIVLYPSELQVNSTAFEAAMHSQTIRNAPADPAGFDRDHPNQTLQKYCQSRDLRCFDVTPAMRLAAAASPEPLYLPRNGHFNVRGNRVAAEAEAKFLRQELCKPADKGDQASDVRSSH